MANLVLSDLAIVRELEAILADFNATTVRLKLFQNNVVPDKSTVIGAFVEATFGGYAAQIVNDFGSASIAAHVARTITGQYTFLCSGGPSNNIYGYYITNAGGTILLWSQRDDEAPVPIGNLGDQYFVTPALDHESKYP